MRARRIAARWLTLSLLVACGPAPAADARLSGQCARLAGGERTRAAGLSVYVGSRLPAPGELQVGAVGRCDDAEAAALFVRAHGVLAVVPAGLRPSDVVLHAAPAAADGVAEVRVLEYHRPARALLAGRGAAALPASVWLHELGHLRAATRLPAAEPARSVLAALDEGVADYYAATITESPRVGAVHAGTVRDLAAPPAPRATDWAQLAMPDGHFDVHAMGWQLAGHAHRLEPRAGPLLSAWLACMGGLEGLTGGPGPVMRDWLARCPEGERPRLTSMVRAWMPELLDD